jgi:pyruvate/2-oxoglutarate dehydrogenase complex dihydrolipoamide acyltransferase (E2) component
MTTQLTVPDFGKWTRRILIVRCHKQDGDVVAVGEPLCDLDIKNKALIEFETAVAGVVHWLKKEGDTVVVGEAICQIDEAHVPLKAVQ